MAPATEVGEGDRTKLFQKRLRRWKAIHVSSPWCAFRACHYSTDVESDLFRGRRQAFEDQM